MAATACDGTPAKNAAVASSLGEVRAALVWMEEEAERRRRVGGWADGWTGGVVIRISAIGSARSAGRRVASGEVGYKQGSGEMSASE